MVKEFFKPLLIGRSLDETSNHLDKFLKFYESGFNEIYSNCFLCYYSLYNFDINKMNFSFTYYNIKNNEFMDKNFKNTIYLFFKKCLMN